MISATENTKQRQRPRLTQNKKIVEETLTLFKCAERRGSVLIDSSLEQVE